MTASAVPAANRRVTLSNLVKKTWAKKRVTKGLLETMGLMTTMSAMPWRERIAELTNPKAASIDRPTAAIGLASPACSFR